MAMKRYLMEELHKPESTARQYVNGAIHEDESLFDFNELTEMVKLDEDKMYELMDALDDVFHYCERNYQTYEIAELKKKNDELQRERKDEKDCYVSQMDLWDVEKRKLNSRIDELEQRISKLNHENHRLQLADNKWWKKDQQWQKYYDHVEPLRQKVERHWLLCRLLKHQREEKNDE